MKHTTEPGNSSSLCLLFLYIYPKSAIQRISISNLVTKPLLLAYAEDFGILGAWKLAPP